jgi:hypothetical protein
LVVAGKDLLFRNLRSFAPLRMTACSLLMTRRCVLAGARGCEERAASEAGFIPAKRAGVQGGAAQHPLAHSG